MKKYLNLLSLLVAVLLVTSSCDKKDELIVFDNVNGQTMIQLTQSSATVPTSTTGATFEITVLSTTVSDSDRTVQYEVVPQTDPDLVSATPDQYSIGNITIPAGSYSGKLIITTNYDALPETGESFLTVNITGIEGSSAIVENGSVNFKFFRKCDLVLEDFVGSWSGTTSYGYPTQVVTSLVDKKLYITGIGVGFMQNDWGEVIQTMETLPMNIDIDSGSFTIDEALYMTTTYNGAPQPAYNLSAVGTINPCTGEMHLDYDFIQDGTSYTSWLTQGYGWPPFIEDIVKD